MFDHFFTDLHVAGPGSTIVVFLDSECSECRIIPHRCPPSGRGTSQSTCSQSPIAPEEHLAKFIYSNLPTPTISSHPPSNITHSTTPTPPPSTPTLKPHTPPTLTSHTNLAPTQLHTHLSATHHLPLSYTPPTSQLHTTYLSATLPPLSLHPPAQSSLSHSLPNPSRPYPPPPPPLPHDQALGSVLHLNFHLTRGVGISTEC
ncbi:hypothetical protein Pmani_011791 [Petrolisthes manimaculis]|uniref:Uncharacterized protein n=1 Tax=Petrolisthes manimaculis TaxID=1843537 RepID=A0AAE1PZ99_9EUCA|nr:hypothetical protein Pmani_011791 [Petrolisthes manimaculis]